MKIVSWNVNGFRARQEAIHKLVEEINPDILCLQKVRINSGLFMEIPGYMGWVGPMDGGLFGGVSTYTRLDLDLDFEKQAIPIPQWLRETTCINVINLEKFFLVNAYFPYANRTNHHFMELRHQWDYEFHDFIVALTARKPVVLCGDLNIVAGDIDAWDNVSVKHDGCFFPWEHRNFDAMVRQAGLIDTFRFLHPDERGYTFFYNNDPDCRLANKGFRIDYFLVSTDLMTYVTSSTILSDITATSTTPILLTLNP